MQGFRSQKTNTSSLHAAFTNGLKCTVLSARSIALAYRDDLQRSRRAIKTSENGGESRSSRRDSRISYFSKALAATISSTSQVDATFASFRAQASFISDVLRTAEFSACHVRHFSFSQSRPVLCYLSVSTNHQGFSASRRAIADRCLCSRLWNCNIAM
jgi:hypothetical protein